MRRQACGPRHAAPKHDSPCKFFASVPQRRLRGQSSCDFFAFVPTCILEKAFRRPIRAHGSSWRAGRRRLARARRKGQVSDLRKCARPFQAACRTDDEALRSCIKTQKLHEVRPFLRQGGTETEKSHSGRLAESLASLRPGAAGRQGSLPPCKVRCWPASGRLRWDGDSLWLLATRRCLVCDRLRRGGTSAALLSGAARCWSVCRGARRGID